MRIEHALRKLLCSNLVSIFKAVEQELTMHLGTEDSSLRRDELWKRILIGQR